jgi:hypothetical protein
MEGRQPNRRGESLTFRQKKVLAVVGAMLIVLAAGVGAWAATNPGSYGRSGHGCVNVVFASSTGGAVMHRCGAAAQAMCRHAVSHTSRLATLTREQCRLAGLLPTTPRPAPTG